MTSLRSAAKVSWVITPASQPGFSYGFNVGALAKTAYCAPDASFASPPPPTPIGMVVQFWDGVAPTGSCNVSSGGTMPCTVPCEVLTGVGAPVAQIHDATRPWAGIDLIFPSADDYKQNPFSCMTDPNTGYPTLRRVTYEFNCDPSATELIVDDVLESSSCFYVFSIRSQSACGQLVPRL